MTYCVGVMIDAGVVLASDSRTNAGVDNISTFRKMKVFEKPGDRVITLVNSGNLAVTQATLNLLEQPMRRAVDTPSIMTVGTMWEVAELVGVALREVRHRDGPHLMQTNVDASANFIIGGQIAGEPPRLFMVYTEGNFIEATAETPYFQIGETKYGKPIIDRVVKADSSLDDVVKCVLVSFDSTMRSNLSVGLPIDLLVYDKDSLRVTRTRRFDEQDAYIRTLSREWGEGVRRAFVELPKLEW
jgi:putative proteasome-type protease